MKKPVSTRESSSSAVSISLFGKESITVSETQTFLIPTNKKQDWLLFCRKLEGRMENFAPHFPCLPLTQYQHWFTGVSDTLQLFPSFLDTSSCFGPKREIPPASSGWALLVHWNTIPRQPNTISPLNIPPKMKCCSNLASMSSICRREKWNFRSQSCLFLLVRNPKWISKPKPPQNVTEKHAVLLCLST